jgi:hypothetical protein
MTASLKLSFKIIAFLSILLLSYSTLVVYAESPLTEVDINGNVLVDINSDREPVVDINVNLHQLIGDTFTTISTSTDSFGKYKFSGISIESNALCSVSVLYQEISYSTNFISCIEDEVKFDVIVYEPTTDNSFLVVNDMSIVLASIDPMEGKVWILEMADLNNTGDKTYVPGKEPMSLVRFGLPEDYFELAVDTDLSDVEILSVDKGFALSGNIPPGSHKIMYQYSLLYSKGGLNLRRSFLYGVKKLRVLIPEGITFVTDIDTFSENMEEIEERKYTEFISIDLKRGEKVTFEISQLPVLNLFNRFYTEIRTTYFDDLILVMMGLVLTVIFGVLYRSHLKNKEV